MTENIPFTNDLMFSLVMRDEEICRDFLQMVLPEEDFGEIRLMRSDNPLIEDEPIYVFRTADEKGLILNDETYKIIINTACSPEKVPDNLKSFFSYINAPDTAHRSALVEKIDTRVRKYNTSDWRRKQMTLQELMDREHEIGHEEGFALGIEQGIEQGIESVIAVYREFNVSEDDAKAKIKNGFSINEEMIEVYFKKYWK